MALPVGVFGCLAAEQVTLIIASYSLAQFLAMPLWGHISDQRGRRPVLLISMAGHVASYVMLAYADGWPMLLAARILGGVTSANLVTAYAYSTEIPVAVLGVTPITTTSPTARRGMSRTRIVGPLP